MADVEDEQGGQYEDQEQIYTVGYQHLNQLQPPQREGIERITNGIMADMSMTNALRDVGRLRLEPVDKFKVLMMIYYNKFGAERISNITLEDMLNKLPRLTYMQFRNPIGYVLGAIVLDRTHKIDRSKLDLVQKSFKETLKLEDISVEDIIRYGRIWENLMK